MISSGSQSLCSTSACHHPPLRAHAHGATPILVAPAVEGRDAQAREPFRERCSGGDLLRVGDDRIHVGRPSSVTGRFPVGATWRCSRPSFDIRCRGFSACPAETPRRADRACATRCKSSSTDASRGVSTTSVVAKVGRELDGEEPAAPRAACQGAPRIVEARVAGVTSVRRDRHDALTGVNRCGERNTSLSTTGHHSVVSATA